MLAERWYKFHTEESSRSMPADQNSCLVEKSVEIPEELKSYAPAGFCAGESTVSTAGD